MSSDAVRVVSVPCPTSNDTAIAEGSPQAGREARRS